MNYFYPVDAWYIAAVGNFWTFWSHSRFIPHLHPSGKAFHKMLEHLYFHAGTGLGLTFSSSQMEGYKQSLQKYWNRDANNFGLVIYWRHLGLRLKDDLTSWLPFQLSFSWPLHLDAKLNFLNNLKHDIFCLMQLLQKTCNWILRITEIKTTFSNKRWHVLVVSHF